MNTYIKKLALIAATVTGVLFSNFSFAHAGHDDSMSFMSGLFHPFSGIDHLLVIVLVGFWSAFVLKKWIMGPGAFLVGMSLGVFGGIVGLSLSFFEFGIAISVISVGILLLVKKQYSSNLALAFVAMFGVFHGYAHVDAFTVTSPSLTLLVQDLFGLLLATALLHLSGALIVKSLKDKSAIVAKVAGLSSLAYGTLILGQLSFLLLGGASA